MSRTLRIRQALETAFSPSHLEVLDESSLHKGHAGAGPQGESHYRIRISSAFFVGKSRVAQHYAINQALTHEFSAGLHALAIEIVG
jgi:BolA family transcriptional regulator, general stress-responsive regulator